jgi:hypothetical protein
MNNKHYNIVFATPGASMHREYVKSLVETCSWLAEEEKTFTLLNRNASFVPNAREWTAINGVGSEWEFGVVGKGEFTYDRMVWIDSDISWELEDFKRLISHEEDIVSGVMLVDSSGRIGATRFNLQGSPGIMTWTDIMLDDPDELLEVDGVSFGFLSVKSGVFESMKRPWFRLREVPVEKIMVTLGEDYSWCLNAKEAGFSVFLDIGVKVAHHKEQILGFRR